MEALSQLSYSPRTGFLGDQLTSLSRTTKDSRIGGGFKDGKGIRDQAIASLDSR